MSRTIPSSCVSRRAARAVRLSSSLCFLLAACQRHDGDKPAAAGRAGQRRVDSAAAPARRLRAGLRQFAKPRFAHGADAALQRELASAQTFDKLIAVTGPNGEVVNGSWSLDDDGRTLSFPFVQANTRYVVQLHAGAARRRWPHPGAGDEARCVFRQPARGGGLCLEWQRAAGARHARPAAGVDERARCRRGVFPRARRCAVRPVLRLSAQWPSRQLRARSRGQQLQQLRRRRRRGAAGCR